MRNKHIHRICLSPAHTIRDALKTLAVTKPAETNLPAGIVLITDSRKRLVGIATDGDLRRALAADASLEAPLSRVMNRNVFYVESPQTHSEILAQAAAKIRQEGWHASRLSKIIVVDRERRVLDVVSFFDLWQASDIRFKRIGVVGLGYVGLTLGLTLADLGFNVLGFDTNQELARAIRRRKAPFYEEGLETFLRDHVGKRFELVASFVGKNRCDAYVIAVGTPLSAKGIPNLTHIKAAAANLGGVLKRGDVVILRSTVPLGTTRTAVIPLLEKRSGLSAGEDFLVAFAPERTVEGNALKELRTLPQVIGGLNRASANLASSIFNLMTDTVFILDSLEEAEMVKLINNTYRDVTFAFSNEVALVCQKWGMDTNKVVDAANIGYSRSQVPKPSPGVGGYCLEKDPFLFVASARAQGYEPRLVPHARAVHKEILKALATDIHSSLAKAGRKDPRVFVMGFAFKGDPLTSDMRGSPTVELVRLLQGKNLGRIRGYDPLVGETQIRALGVAPVADVARGVRGADAVVVMTNHSEFRDLDMRAVLTKARNRATLFYDTWALYRADELRKVRGLTYKRL